MYMSYRCITTRSENVYFKSINWALIYLLYITLCMSIEKGTKKYNEYTIHE